MPQTETLIVSLLFYIRKRTLPLFFILGGMAIGAGQETSRDSLMQMVIAQREQKNFTPKDTSYINLLNNLGNKLRYFNGDSLLLLSREAWKNSKTINYLKGESEALKQIGYYYSDKGDTETAIQNFIEAIKIARKNGNKKLSLGIQNDLANEYGYNGDYAKALKMYLKAVELAAELKDNPMLSIINENIANLYVAQKDYNQALNFYKKVKKINDTVGNESSSAETMSNLASIYAETGNFDYALFNINKSIAVFEKHKILDWLAYAFETKGKIYLKQDKYRWALYWYDQSEMLHKKIEDDRGKIDLFNGMSEAYFNLGKDSISEEYALKAFKISTKIKFLEGTQECAKTLYRINKNKGDFEKALEYHELYQKMTDILFRDENKRGLTMLKTKMEYEKQKELLIIENEKALSKQKGYFYTAFVILLLFIIITLMIKRGWEIQKKLNTELKIKKNILEKREHELKHINETKDKLFSIIAHDLRGPIGALQGLLNLFKDNEMGRKEFLAFMPKLRNDVSHISFTLNNLLSWGFSQMNGVVTKPTSVPLEGIVGVNINLLSDMAQNKSIKITNKLLENSFAWCDSNQIDIVIRNLISNALKFTPESGKVTIDALDKDDHWQISIQDSGIGMDKETLGKILNKNTNLTTYGTNNEKGTGLGLSLCKEMIEKNKGAIWVESIPGKGSCFYFTLPKKREKYRKIA